MFEKLNSKRTIREGIENLEDMQFVKLKDFVGYTVPVDGYFFTNGKYGKAVVVVAKGYKINMPARALDQFEQIDSDPDMLNAMLQGHLAIKDIAERKTKNGTTTAYSLTDI